MISYADYIIGEKEAKWQDEKWYAKDDEKITVQSFDRWHHLYVIKIISGRVVRNLARLPIDTPIIYRLKV